MKPPFNVTNGQSQVIEDIVEPAFLSKKLIFKHVHYWSQVGLLSRAWIWT